MFVFCSCDRAPLIAGFQQLCTIEVALAFGEVGRLIHSHRAGRGEIEDARVTSCHCAGSAEKTNSFGL